MIITKVINQVFLSGRLQGQKSGRLENQAVTGTPPARPVEASEIQSSEIKKTINGSVVTFEGIYQGKPIRVRIFNAPTQEPNLAPK